MDNIKTLRNYALILLISFAIGFIVGRCSVVAEQPRETTITRIDTLRVDNPIPYEVEKIRTVSVPVYVPTPADTVVQVRVDTVLVDVPVEVERRVYKSDLYRAVVSGASIGGLRPSLDDIEVYAKHTTTTIEKPYPLFAPYITGFGGKDLLGLGGGVFIKGHHGIGAEYMKVDNSDKLAFRYIYKF